MAQVFRGSKTPTELRRHYLDEYMGHFGHVMPKEMLVPAATPYADGSPSYTTVVPVPDEVRVWDKDHTRFGDAVDSAFVSRRRYGVSLLYCSHIAHVVLVISQQTVCLLHNTLDVQQLVIATNVLLAYTVP
jgi:hypothetical protein